MINDIIANSLLMSVRGSFSGHYLSLLSECEKSAFFRSNDCLIWLVQYFFAVKVPYTLQNAALRTLVLAMLGAQPTNRILRCWRAPLKSDHFQLKMGFCRKDLLWTRYDLSLDTFIQRVPRIAGMVILLRFQAAACGSCALSQWACRKVFHKSRCLL